MYRVVVVDDQAEFRSWLRALLDASSDFQVVGEASGGEEALRLVPLLGSDVVIADVHMPDVDGLDVARRVREDWPTTRVVLVSGHASRTYARLAAQEGAAAFIPKSQLSLEALRQVLRPAESR